ncbi:MAG TPA: DNA-directed RNA polymerase subunit H [Candidatus Nanoarchaeia archaeon]|nr:DNA-directed RNA polymerase subunit H [Candidatus Nanoarchaeia archaeon]
MKKPIVEKHILVPKHSKLGEAEKKKLLETYVVSYRDLPHIRSTDPAIASLEVKEGDIIKINRKSPTAGESVFFRSVVDG